jgi:hypothetical protein
MFAKTVTLVANTDTLIDLGETCDGFVITNQTATALHVNIDQVAEADADGSILVPASGTREIRHRGQIVHAISTGTPKVEVLGYRRSPR